MRRRVEVMVVRRRSVWVLTIRRRGKVGVLVMSVRRSVEVMAVRRVRVLVLRKRRSAALRVVRRKVEMLAFSKRGEFGIASGRMFHPF